MRNLIAAVIALVMVAGVVSCGGKEEEKANVGVDQNTPEYKAYDIVQNLKAVKDLKASAEAKNQTISLKMSKDLLNKGKGFYWFQVVQHVGSATVVKLNLTVSEQTFDVLIRDDETGDNLTPEEYDAKYGAD